jgi:hypothetical protein
VPCPLASVICRFPPASRLPQGSQFTPFGASLRQLTSTEARQHFLKAPPGSTILLSTVQKSRPTSPTSARAGVVRFLEPLNRKIAFGAKLVKSNGTKLEHLVLGQKRAHKICHNGVPSRSDLRDHCWHEEGREEKSLWYATSSIKSPYTLANICPNHRL